MKDFQTSRTPAVLYDNHIIGNPHTAYVGIDNNEGMDLAVAHLKALGHQKIAYLSSALGSHIMQVRHRAFFQHASPRSENRFQLCRMLHYLSECRKNIPRFLDMGNDWNLMSGHICKRRADPVSTHTAFLRTSVL